MAVMMAQTPGGLERPLTKYDEKVIVALKKVLRADHLAIIPHWMKVASLEDKHGITNLQRLAEAQGMRPPSGKWSPARPRTEFDIRVESALKNAIKPELHGVVPVWMQGATLEEKRGILTKLDYHTESKLIRTIGRPMGRGPEPSVAVAPWFSPKWSPNGSMGSTGGLMKSRSLPGLGMMLSEPPEYVIPSWMHEDHAEVENIPKPGGARLKLKDSVTIQSMKNKERNNRGTYRLFSGSFDDTTTTGTAHSLDAVGMSATFA